MRRLVCRALLLVAALALSAPAFGQQASSAAGHEREMDAARQAGDHAKAIELGERLLALDPDHLNAQMTVSGLLPERPPLEEPARTEVLDRAMELGQMAHDQVEATFRGPKPAEFTDEQWAERKRLLEARVHATLGLIHLRRTEYDDAVFMYEYVVELMPGDGLHQLRLGLAYDGQVREAQEEWLRAVIAENFARSNQASATQIAELVAVRQAAEEDFFAKRDKAIDTLARAVALGGEPAHAARQHLEPLYRSRNNYSLDGLPQLIQQKKRELGVE